MSDGIDLLREAKELPQRPRGRACIVLTQDSAGQKRWAAKLAALANAAHLDLLDHFASSPALMAAVGECTVQKLFDLLGSMKDRQVLVVSGLEFLVATWTGQPKAMEQFAHSVEYWDRSPALLLVLQDDGFLRGRRFTRYPQYRFVVEQKETFVLS